MRSKLAESLMDEFAESTGVSGNAPPRRYLWTDAFAVCNFLGLGRDAGGERYLKLAFMLVDQVHHVLGRHRGDDPRRGWISGLSEEEGERHPTRGGLRIGKRLNERPAGQPPDARLEWDRDGQYFHYLTKWMHALFRVSRETGEDRYLQWAAELAVAAHDRFTYAISPGGPKRMVWKMSIDLTRPLVDSMGQHDPLDGLVGCLELQTCEAFPALEEVDLARAIADMTHMSRQGRWATDDSLGIGGLLDDAARLAQMVFGRRLDRRDLLLHLLREANVSLRAFANSSSLRRSAEHRLAFRELGLSIGLRQLDLIAGVVSGDDEVAEAVDALRAYRPLADQIEDFWSNPVRQASGTWREHRDINMVMLATSLAPAGYAGVA